MAPELSVVVPVLNEEAVLPLFIDRLRPVLDALGVTYEVVCVDDGSSDATPVVLQRHLRTWPELRVVRLRTNAGHQAALSAGLTRSRGTWVVTIDADLQDPPEVIPDMLAATRDGATDVVYGVRTDRSTDTRFKRATAGGFYRVMGRLGATGIAGAGDFRLMSRPTVDAVLALPEQNRVLRLVVPSLGFPSAVVGYRRDERAAGTSKYPLRTMIRLSVDSVIGLSNAPLRLATWFGLAGFVLAFCVAGYAVFRKLTGDSLTGWASTVCIIAGFGALQLLCLGILGEYVGRLYLAMQARPTHYVAYDSLDVARRSAASEPVAGDGLSGDGLRLSDEGLPDERAASAAPAPGLPDHHGTGRAL